MSQSALRKETRLKIVQGRQSLIQAKGVVQNAMRLGFRVSDYLKALAVAEGGLDRAEEMLKSNEPDHRLICAKVGLATEGCAELCRKLQDEMETQIRVDRNIQNLSSNLDSLNLDWPHTKQTLEWLSNTYPHILGDLRTRFAACDAQICQADGWIREAEQLNSFADQNFLEAEKVLNPAELNIQVVRDLFVDIERVAQDVEKVERALGSLE